MFGKKKKEKDNCCKAEQACSDCGGKEKCAPHTTKSCGTRETKSCTNCGSKTEKTCSNTTKNCK